MDMRASLVRRVLLSYRVAHIGMHALNYSTCPEMDRKPQNIAQTDTNRRNRDDQ